ncbi:MAG TPA: hypothetical protein VGS07_08205 [Thermoanaerobaculia bacterium]|jgi:hypothetical protein|nr:hypothetical protein [Thermoanaerobaculia bacterium]
MDNLTSGRRIAYPSRNLDPVPGHDLVVLKRGGKDGLKIRALLRPGEHLQKSLRDRRSSLVGYVVKHEERLRHRFSRSYKTAGQMGALILDFAIDFEVSDPVLLVLSLDSDPLRRLEGEVDTLIRSAVSRASEPGFGEEVSSVLDSHVAEVRSFALALGLKVRNVSRLSSGAASRELGIHGSPAEPTVQSERLDIRDLRGAGGIRPDYDYKALRTEDPHES